MVDWYAGENGLMNAIKHAKLHINRQSVPRNRNDPANFTPKGLDIRDSRIGRWYARGQRDGVSLLAYLEIAFTSG